MSPLVSYLLIDFSRAHIIFVVFYVQVIVSNILPTGLVSYKQATKCLEFEILVTYANKAHEY